MAIIKYFISSLKKIFKKKKRTNRKTKRAGHKKPSRSRKRTPRRKISSSKVPRVRKASRGAPKKSKRTPRLKKPLFKKTQTTAQEKEKGILVGEVTHYFSRIYVVVVRVTKNLAVGDQIRIKGRSTDFSQKVSSMQIESLDVKSARKGQLIGLKVIREAREGDKVYKIS